MKTLNFQIFQSAAKATKKQQNVKLELKKLMSPTGKLISHKVGNSNEKTEDCSFEDDYTTISIQKIYT